LREITFRQAYPPVRWLEWAGLWSYSLYLLHPAVATVFGNVLPNLYHGWLRWSLECIFVFAGCYAFYLIAERPGHAIARGVSKSLRPKIPNASFPTEATQIE
jgi:peptidoglycan/LPS O-acetylase OafA/YrhL